MVASAGGRQVPVKGRGVPRARPGPARARRRPTRQSRPGTWRRPAPRRPPRPTPCQARAVGRGAVVGRRSWRGGQAGCGTGRVPARRAQPAAGQPQEWARMRRQARRSGRVMSFDNPHDRREPCLLHLAPAHSPHHHQPVKPELCRGPASVVESVPVARARRRAQRSSRAGMRPAGASTLGRRAAAYWLSVASCQVVAAMVPSSRVLAGSKLTTGSLAPPSHMKVADSVGQRRAWRAAYVSSA
jgi:hypothetical protein